MRVVLFIATVFAWGVLMVGVLLLLASVVVPDVPAVLGIIVTAMAVAFLGFSQVGKRLSGSRPAGIRTLQDKSQAAPGEWYRLAKWETENYFMCNAEPALGWEAYSLFEPVAGVTHGNREAALLRIFLQPGFRLYLQREPENPYDPHAVMVMGTAVIGGRQEIHHLGYIERATAKKLARAGDLGVIPYGVWLSKPGVNYGLRIVILVRQEQQQSGKPAGRRRISNPRSSSF